MPLFTKKNLVMSVQDFSNIANIYKKHLTRKQFMFNTQVTIDLWQQKVNHLGKSIQKLLKQF